VGEFVTGLEKKRKRWGGTSLYFQKKAETVMPGGGEETWGSDKELKTTKNEKKAIRMGLPGAAQGEGKNRGWALS